MDYIMHTRFRGKAICGDVNIPAKTPLENLGGVIYWKGNPLFVDRSQNALDYATRNDDGRGMERAKLVASIKRTLGNKDKNYQDRWNKVWGDKICLKYKRTDHEDWWLWNNGFYNAPINDLEHIIKIINEVT